MDRLVEKSVFVTAARLGLMRLKAPAGSARETGSEKQEKLVCTPGSTIDGPGPPGWAGPPRSPAGLGAGNGSGPLPWPRWGPALEDRPKQAGPYRSLLLQEAVDVLVGKSSGSDALGGRRDFRGRVAME